MVDRTKWCEKREGERAVTWPHDIMQNTPFVYCECSDTHADSFLTNYGHLPIRVSLTSVARDIRDGRQTALEFLKLLLPGIEGVEYPSWTILRKGAPLSQSRFWAHWPKSISGGGRQQSRVISTRLSLTGVRGSRSTRKQCYLGYTATQLRNKIRAIRNRYCAGAFLMPWYASVIEL